MRPNDPAGEITIPGIAAILAGQNPQQIGAEGFSRAAVALVLRERPPSGVEFLAIHRAHRRGDPWSGHMALPGGRQHPDDIGEEVTARRETREEVGLDLASSGRLLGCLDDLQAVGRGKLMNLIIRPFVYELTTDAEPVIDRREVQSAVWIGLATLRHERSRGVHRQRYGEEEHEFPAFLHGAYTIWGLTHRILTGFLDLIGPPSR